MKKWTWKDVRLLVLAGRGVAPTPFPGKYPTRVAWRVENGGAEHFYIGKPSMNAVQKFLSYARQPNVTAATFYEFDRKHLIARRNNAGAIIAHLTYATHSTLKPYYHPFWLAQHVPGTIKFYCNKVGKHWIYSDMKTVPLEHVDYIKRVGAQNGWPT